MKKTLFNVITTQHLKERVDTILMTWGKDIIDNNIVFYSDHNDEEKNVVKRTLSENTGQYNSCPEKLYYQLKNLKESNSSYDWYVFIDDDTFVNTKNLYQFLETADDEKSYASHANWGHPQGGAGFIISNKTLNKIDLKPFNSYTETRFSDEFIGFIYQDCNLEWVWSPGMFHNAGINPEFSKTVLTQHPVRTREDMLLLYGN